jgi:DNA repair protein RecO (recombination protein O)
VTVTAASTLDGYPRLRHSGPALSAAARACDAVLRLLDSAEANPPAYNLLCRYLALLDDPSPEAGVGLHTALSFRLKLALAAGFAPELGACARCRAAEHLTGFSGAAGGIVCASCERGSFELSPEAHGFMVESLAQPLAAAPQAAQGPLRQVERAVSETLEHHAHVRLRAAA